LPFLNRRDAADDLLVQHTHVAACLFIAEPDLLAEGQRLVVPLVAVCREFVSHLGTDCREPVVHLSADCREFVAHLGADYSKFVAHLSTNCRKLVVHLGAELHNLRRKSVDPFRQLLEFRHACFQLFYSVFKDLRRHSSSLLRSESAVAT